MRETRHELLLTTAGLHLRESEAGGKSRVIAGYAVVFGVKSDPLASDEALELREIIEPGAITRELLDQCDIKFTMFHDRQLILARSHRGQGTLKYSIDEKGVAFEFEAPDTIDGDKAVELVKRGDISGCSFAFTTRYYDSDCVSRDVDIVNGRKIVTYRVKQVLNVFDMTLASDPAYPATSVEARELIECENKTEASDDSYEVQHRERVKAQVKEMRECINNMFK